MSDLPNVPIPEGKCRLCGRTFPKEEMTKHLEACMKQESRKRSEKSETRKGKAFHLVVEGEDLPQYWMHLEAPAEATLEDLDDFLREVWLECCGHLSLFRIGDQTYTVEEAREHYDESMDIPLAEVLRPGLEFAHEYDMGTTTELALRVVSEREAEVSGTTIRVLARNEPPEIKCEECGKPAKQVCTECYFDGTGYLCEGCAPKHEHDEELHLPVLNSPRTGLCGYGREWHEEPEG